MFWRSPARVVLACRDLKKGEAARESIVKGLTGAGAGSVEVRALDLSSTASIRAFVEKWGQTDLHILMNNVSPLYFVFFIYFIYFFVCCVVLCIGWCDVPAVLEDGRRV